MIPDWDSATGNLPEGIHQAGWKEVEERLGFNPRRRRLLQGLGDEPMSITNSRQYRISKAQLTRFQQAVDAGEHERSKPQGLQESIALDALLAQARQQADDLRQQLEEYEGLAGSRTMTLQIHSLSDLPTALKHARLASGLTQSDLARRLGVTEQQVQRDEKTDYAQASLDRLQRIWRVLGVRLDGQVTLSSGVESDDALSCREELTFAEVNEDDRVSRAGLIAK